MKDFLSVEDGVLFYGTRMMIPQSLIQDYLKRIHMGHLGITKSQNRAKESVFWKNMTKDIEEYIGDCKECLIYSRSNLKEPMLSHNSATGPWQIISSDLFEFDNTTYVLVADQYSKMPFVRNLGQNTRSRAVIDFLEELFSVHGTCSILMSDNGPQYSSHEFKEFVKSWDFKHITSSPHYPQSNGFIERMVGVVKNILKKAKASKTNLHKALLAYRSCPLNHDDKSPAELMFQRKIQSNLPVRVTSQDNQSHYERIQIQKDKTAVNYNKSCGQELSKLLPGMKILVQDGKAWYPATVKSQADEPRSYILITPNGKEIRRNRKFLKELSVKASSKFDFDHNTSEKNTSQIACEPPTSETMPMQQMEQKTPKSVRFSDRNSICIIPPRPRSTRQVKRPKRLIEEYD